MKNTWLVYISLFCAAYISVYIDYRITPLFVWPILIISYYLILIKRRVEPVLFLILSSKFITGFAVPTNTSAFMVVNLLVNYLPIFIVLIIHTLKRGHLNIISNYKFTICYLVFALLYSIPHPELASQLIVKEYFPLLMFVLTAGIFYKNIDYSVIVRFLRPLLICSLVVYIIPERFETNIILNTLPLLNRIPTQETINFISLDVFRNSGFLWDTRSMGVVCYIFLYITLRKDRENFNFNMLVGVVVLLSTLSRGAIGVGIIILFTYFITEVVNGRFIKPMLILLTLITASIGIVGSGVVEVEDNFFGSFNLTSDNNALSQRSGFREYSLEHFYEHPMGSGVGYLKGVGPDRNIPIKGGTFHTVNDAFLFSKLGEMGALGFILFLLSLSEVILSRKLYSLMLLLGIVMQLTGTDLPDTKQFYFVFLVLLSRLNIEGSKKQLYRNGKYFEKN